MWGLGLIATRLGSPRFESGLGQSKYFSNSCLEPHDQLIIPWNRLNSLITNKHKLINSIITSRKDPQFVFNKQKWIPASFLTNKYNLIQTSCLKRKTQHWLKPCSATYTIVFVITNESKSVTNKSPHSVRIVKRGKTQKKQPLVRN